MLKKYLNDTSGQFAIMFGICMTALVMSIGTAVDISAMHKERAALQSLTDSAVLAAAVLKTEDMNKLKAAVDAAINANNLGNLNIATNVTLLNETISVEAKTVYKTRLMGVVGIDDLPIAAKSSSGLGKQTPVNMALVLDTTASMNGQNMADLKTASNALLDAFQNVEPGNIRAGVVPYAQYVNVGLNNRDRSWMDVPADSTSTGEETCYMTKDLVDSSLCTTTTTDSTCTNDGVTSNCTNTSQTCPPEAYGEEYEYCYTPTYGETWHGCVGSRDNPNHTTPEYMNKKFPGIMNITCGSEILDLTTNLNDVRAKINSLVATGNTYIPSGLAWGWRMLHPEIPYGGLTNEESGRKRTLILMTDGANTVELAAPKHIKTADSTPTEKLSKELCRKIKKDGIEIYTIAYKFPQTQSKGKNTVKKCASSESHFFRADNLAELELAFKEIAGSLFEVRLTK